MTFSAARMPGANNIGLHIHLDVHSLNRHALVGVAFLAGVAAVGSWLLTRILEGHQPEEVHTGRQTREGASGRRGMVVKGSLSVLLRMRMPRTPQHMLVCSGQNDVWAIMARIW